jgi:hypothetical protein
MEAALEGRVENYPARVLVRPALEERRRLSTFFRFFLSIPHLLLVGGPVAPLVSLGWSMDSGVKWDWGSGPGLLGAAIAVVAMISWFAILFTGRQPDALWRLTTFYMRWRVRAVSYLMLLRDEYPPFGDGEYPVDLELAQPAERDRLTVAFRLLLAIPHLCLLWVLGIAWAFTTAAAWVAILITGRYPATLYGFAIGVLAWGTRVEAYLLLLRDEYPPFTLRA